MNRAVCGAAVAVALLLASAGSAYADGRNPINAYRVKATPKNLERLALAGYDVTEGRRNGMVEVYGTAGQLRKLRSSAGVNARLVKDRLGRTSSLRSARAARSGLKAHKADTDPYTGSDAAYKIW